MKAFDFVQALDAYAKSPWNNSPTLLKLFKSLLRKSRSFYRDHFEPGHFTASSFVFDSNREQGLLIHHKTLDKWLQPGGHADGDENLLRVAQRELFEECGVNNLNLAWNGIIDIDRHSIPAREKEASHFHYDVRFLWNAHIDKIKLKIEKAELKDAQWMSWDDAKKLKIDASVSRLFEKALALKRYRRASEKAVRDTLNTNL